MKINNENENNISRLYKTSDLGLATTLSLHFPIKKIDRNNPRKVVFAFVQTKELDDFVNKYWLNSIAVEPQTFINQIKNIKTRIYAGE